MTPDSPSYSCAHTKKALELDPNAKVNRGINWDWVYFTSEQATDDFYQYMSHNYNGRLRHHHLEVRWG